MATAVPAIQCCRRTDRGELRQSDRQQPTSRATGGLGQQDCGPKEPRQSTRKRPSIFPTDSRLPEIRRGEIQGSELHRPSDRVEIRRDEHMLAGRRTIRKDRSANRGSPLARLLWLRATAIADQKTNGVQVNKGPPTREARREPSEFPPS